MALVYFYCKIFCSCITINIFVHVLLFDLLKALKSLYCWSVAHVLFDLKRHFTIIAKIQAYLKFKVCLCHALLGRSVRYLWFCKELNCDMIFIFNTDTTRRYDKMCLSNRLKADLLRGVSCFALNISIF